MDGLTFYAMCLTLISAVALLEWHRTAKRVRIQEITITQMLETEQ